MKKIVIHGSTGSIGTQTLEIVREQKDIEVLGVAAGSNIILLEKQIREFTPKIAAVWDEEKAKELKTKVADLPVKIVSGMQGMIEVAAFEQAEITVTAMVGMIGIRPTIEAIKAGKSIALANKETLVTAGHIIMPMAKHYGVSILPVDSEHSAIFQSLHGEKSSQVERILITASGGPFRTWEAKKLEQVQVEDALNHPNWSMGKKITIDSATMVNKGLEVMEAKWLFDVSLEQIQVVVHPQSIIHSMVEFQDGAVIAQLGTPDMKIPIQYALYYPDRRPMPGERLDFASLGKLTFEEPDLKKFKGLSLALKAAKRGGTLPTVYNAANERAVTAFLERRLSFTGIGDVIEAAMEEHRTKEEPTLEQVLETEQETYDFIESRWGI